MKKELSIILSSLNNALGYPMGDNIEAEIGYKKNDINNLFNKLLEDTNYKISEKDKEIIKNSLKVCLKYIDDWEFPATFDFDKKEVQDFYNEFVRKDFSSQKCS